MKKYLAVFIMILICLLLPMQIRASQSEIGTTVPETHTVSIEAEHASAQYMEGDKGISDAYPVPRFSKPEFKITAKDGYEIKRVLLNGKDVTKRLKSGTLKLSKVYENQVITIETKAASQKDPQITQKPQSTQKPQAPQSQTQQTSQAPEKQNTVKNAEQIQETTETGDQEQQDTTETTDQAQESGNEMSESISQGEMDAMDGANTENEPEVSARHFSFWWILLLLLTAGIIIWLIIVLKKRKNNKDEEKSLDQ